MTKKINNFCIKVPDIMLCIVYAALEYSLLSFVLVEYDTNARQLFPAIETYCLLLFSLFFLYGICKKRENALCIHIIFYSIYGIIQHYAVQLRGGILYLSDVYNLKTAFNVSDSYSIKPTERVVIAVIFVIVLIIVDSYISKNKPNPLNRKHFLILGMVLSIVTVGIMNTTENKYHYNHPFKGWAINGYVYEFIVTTDIRLKKPDGYYKDDYKELDSKTYTSINEKPNIIFIMNESFIDPDTYNFDRNNDLTPFLHELKNDKNCISGTLYSSVIGGMTACMEFEAMTGHSCYFTGSTVQYTAYMKEGNKYGSLARVLNDIGYRTTAFHPYDKTGYNRACAYHTMGFHKYIGYEDLVDSEKGETIPGRKEYLSDEYDFSKLLDIMNDSKERDFILNVTMQNHGGYDQKELIDTKKEVETGIPSLDNYLYLLSLTDKAMDAFVDELKKFDEPVVIVFFGDHQPESVLSIPVDNETVRYKVPYYIWANYDINTDIKYTDITSANYLANILFEAIWKEQPTGWYKYLESLRQQYPSISQNVIFDNNNRLAKDVDLSDYEKKAYYAIWQQK